MSRYVIRQADGDSVALPIGGVGVQFKVDGDSTHGAVSIVEHPISPGGYAVPHTHANEDEISYVLEGILGAEIGGDEVTVEAGQYLFKPRGLKHAFWNPSDRATRIIEIIAPAGIEAMFRTAGTHRLSGTEDLERGLASMAAYGVQPHFEELEAFLARHQLQAPAMFAAGRN